MTTIFRTVLIAVAGLALFSATAGATSRIKDLANIEGVRQNQLIRDVWGPTRSEETRLNSSH